MKHTFWGLRLPHLTLRNLQNLSSKSARKYGHWGEIGKSSSGVGLPNLTCLWQRSFDADKRPCLVKVGMKTNPVVGLPDQHPGSGPGKQ